VEDAADWRGVAAVAEAWGDTVAGWEWEWERWWLGCGGSGCGNDKEGAGMSEADKGSGERGEGCGDVPLWREAERKAEKAMAIGAAAAVPGTCVGLCDVPLWLKAQREAERKAIHANAVGASQRDDRYTYDALVAAMGETAAERNARDEAPLSIGTPLFAEERGGSGYRSMMPQPGAGKSSVKSAADDRSRPVLGLKPKWLADEERLEEVLEAVYRYVRGGLAVPVEWVDELNGLLAAYNDWNRGAACNEMGGQVGGGVAPRTEAECN
jgi:hypothetical protein